MPIKKEDEVSQAARDLYERALSAVDRKNFGIAVEILFDLVSMEPEFYHAHRLLRAAQIKHASEKTGNVLFRKGFARLTSAPSLGMGMANLNSKPREAMIHAYKMLNQDPTNTQGLNLLAQAAQNMGLPEVGVLAAEAAVAASPNNVSFLRMLAELYRAAGQLPKSQEVYERLLKLRPNDHDILHNLKDTTTLIHMKDTKIEEAESYRELIRDTKEAVLLEQESKVMRSEDMIQNLIDDTLRQMNEQPDNLALVRKVADLYTQKHDFDGAQQALEKALQKESGDPSLRRALGEVKVKRVDARLKALKADLARTPDDPRIQQQMAECQAERDQINLEEAERRVHAYPNDLSFRYEVAILYYRRGRVTDALEQFQLAQRSPQHQIMALNYMGLCFRAQKMNDLAINQFQKAEKASIVMDSNKKEIIYNLAETFKQMGKREDALQQFKRIYEVDINFRDVSKKIMALGAS